jgi:uncharacterized protein (TIGR02145 family)
MCNRTTCFLAVLISITLISDCSVNRTKMPLKLTHTNSYPEKEYNGQIWMTENLKNVFDTNGIRIMYFIPNNDSSKIEAYGLLYDYETACKVCPKGWHLPTENEWEQIIDFIGKKSANEMKDSLFWDTKELNLNNKSGFSVRPAGYGNSGEFDNFFGTHAIFWSSTRVYSHFVKCFVLNMTSDSFRCAPQHLTYAFSIRCVRNKKK